MNFFDKCISNDIVNVGLIAWFLAQAIKVILVRISTKKLDFTRFVGSGGMPSSHTSLVVSVATAILRLEGYLSPTFALSLVLAGIVMYDAAGVRRAAGEQAKILNHLVNEWNEIPIEERNSELKELIGHTKIEVYAGALLGIIVSVVYFYLKY